MIKQNPYNLAFLQHVFSEIIRVNLYQQGFIKHHLRCKNKRSVPVIAKVMLKN